MELGGIGWGGEVMGECDVVMCCGAVWVTEAVRNCGWICYNEAVVDSAVSCGGIRRSHPPSLSELSEYEPVHNSKDNRVFLRRRMRSSIQEGI